MSRTRNEIIQSLAPMLVVGAIVAPSAGASERTATELGQSTDPAPAARTATELGQSTDPAPAATQSDKLSQRTATELGQSTNLSPSPTPSGFDRDDVALVGGGVLGLVLIGAGGVVLISRRRGGVRKPRTPVVSS